MSPFFLKCLLCPPLIVTQVHLYRYKATDIAIISHTMCECSAKKQSSHVVILSLLKMKDNPEVCMVFNGNFTNMQEMWVKIR